MTRSPFRRPAAGLRVVEGAKNEVELMLYDEIGPWGVTAQQFKEQLDGIKAKTINLRINSPGGSVFDALAMYNALQEHPARVVSYIDGVAASMASVIALAGDEVRMAENAFFMVHEPWSLVVGNATELRKQADMLEKVGSSLHLAYNQKSPAGAEQISAWMADETWFTATEAHEAGFVDEVITAEDDRLAEIAASFDLSIYAHVPDALTERPEREPTVRDLERALRDAGLSQIAAKAFVAAGRAAANPQRDVEEAGGRDVAPEPEPEPFIPLIAI